MNWDQFMSTVYMALEAIKSGETDGLDVHRTWYEDGEPVEELTVSFNRNVVGREQFSQLMDFLGEHQVEE